MCSLLVTPLCVYKDAPEGSEKGVNGVLEQPMVGRLSVRFGLAQDGFITRLRDAQLARKGSVTPRSESVLNASI